MAQQISPHRIRLVSITLILTGVACAVLETSYFGFNLLPQSIEEAVCDWVCVILMACGGFLYCLANEHGE